MRDYKTLLILLVTFSTSLNAQSIYRTACQGNLSRLDSLLRDTTIQVQDNRGRSLLHWAVACRKPKVFHFLVERGIAVNSEDAEGETPLHMAVRFNNEVLLDSLIALQPNKNWIGQYGPSLLEKAILKKNPGFVKKLVNIGVAVNTVNNRGSTPLEIAMRTKEREISEMLITSGADQNKVRTFKPKGAYLGQQPPGLVPEIFAPNFISTEESEFGSVFNKAGTEFYYGVDVNGKNEIRYSELVDNQWTPPKIIISHERYGFNDPFLSPDEKRLYFISKRAMDGQGELKDQDIWYVERIAEGWSEPINAGPNINSSRNEYYISFTKDGTMYFSSNVYAPEERSQYDYDIYYSKFVDGKFQKAVVLGEAVNTQEYEADVYVDPDESYLIFCGMRPGGFGRGDLYISFKNADGSWSKSQNMGAPINTEHHELCPFVTPDGKYLLYTSDQDIYWVDAKIIEELRPKNGN